MSNVIPFRETEVFKRGRTGEELIQSLLVSDGCFVVPSYDYCRDDKAPKMKGILRSLILPDLDVCKDGRRFWAEVKVKNDATLFRKWNRPEHGIPLRNYRHYLDVAKVSGCPVFLFIVEESSSSILCANFVNLEANCRIYEGDKMSPGGMVFFDRNDFYLLTGFPETDRLAAERACMAISA